MEILIYRIIIAIIVFTTIIILSKQELNNKRNKRQETKKRVDEHYRMQELIQYFIHQLELAETLNDLYILHIKIWANNIRNKNIGPNEFGMFRTKDILTMNKEEVFLGNIWGLNTLTLPCWENHEESEKKLVITQYRNHLISNLKSMLD